jgi:signal transduction histidine kinase
MTKPDTSTKRITPIRRKLLSATIVSGMLAVLIAVGGLYCMYQLNYRLQKVVDVASNQVKLTNLLRQDLISAIRLERNLWLVSGETEFDSISANLDSHLDSIDQHVRNLYLLFNDQDRSRLADFVKKLETWKSLNREYRPNFEFSVFRHARALSISKGESAIEQFEHAIDQLVKEIALQQKAALKSDELENNVENDRASPGANGLNQHAEFERYEKELMDVANLYRDVLKLQRMEKNLIMHLTLAYQVQPVDAIKSSKQQILDQVEAIKADLGTEHAQLFSAAKNSLDDYLQALDEILETVVEKKYNLDGWWFNYRPTISQQAEEAADAMVSKSERLLDQYDTESILIYRRFRNALIALSLFVVAVSTVVSIFIGTGISGNIRSLADYAKNVHRFNDLERPVNVNSNDEIGELATAFDQMRVSLLKQNKELARLNQSLEEKNIDMEQFVYSVSHDLKSPLVSCKGLVGLINEDIEDGDFEEVKNSAQRLSGVTDQMSNTIDDLLTFSRLGRSPLTLSMVDMKELMEQLREQWQDQLVQQQIEMSIAPDLPAVCSELLSVRRVFDNLIGNAIKYAGDSPNATIEIGYKTEPGTVRYFVRDNGPGIEERYHQKIFGLFQRLDNSKTGTGIGLASVAKMVRRLGGRVWVESQPGKGATFWIELTKSGPDIAGYDNNG